MPSRLSRGNSTNARARLEALLRVIDWLTCALTAAGWRAALLWAGAAPRFRPASGCGGDGRGDDAVGGAGGRRGAGRGPLLRPGPGPGRGRPVVPGGGEGGGFFS